MANRLGILILAGVLHVSAGTHAEPIVRLFVSQPGHHKLELADGKESPKFVNSYAASLETTHLGVLFCPQLLQYVFGSF